MAIYNLVGQKVRTLVQGLQAAGEHTVEWDGRDSDGQRLESGMYLYRLKTPVFSQTRKMMLLE